MAWQNWPFKKKTYGRVNHCEILKALQIIGKASKQAFSATLNLCNYMLATRDQSQAAIFYITIS